jgi:hypothetical protein
MGSKEVLWMPNITYLLTSGTDEDFSVAVSALKARQIDFKKKHQ